MDILKSIGGGSTKPTRIMYESNTSWGILQKNFAALLTAGFIQQTGEDTRPEYGITGRGMTILREYAAIMDMAVAENASVS